MGRLTLGTIVIPPPPIFLTTHVLLPPTLGMCAPLQPPCGHKVCTGAVSMASNCVHWHDCNVCIYHGIVRYELLGTILADRAVWEQLVVSLILNWLVGPLLMTGLAWATLPDLAGFRNGVIMVGLARCVRRLTLLVFCRV